MTIAHQYIEQMPEEVRAAVFGNVGTMITFRVGAFDAEVLEKEFAPYFEAQDLVNLGFVQIYLKLMIDGISSQPFSARTLPPIAKPIVSFKKQILENSRKIFGRPRAEVEKNIKEWHDEGTPVKKFGPAGPGPGSSPAGAANATPARTVSHSVGSDQSAPNVASGPAQNTNTVPPVQPPSAKPSATSQNLPVSPTPSHPSKNQSRPGSYEVEKYEKHKPQNHALRPDEVQHAVERGDLTAVDGGNKVKKGDDKGPKPENVNALRNALSSVLKEMKDAEQNKKADQQQSSEKKTAPVKSVPEKYSGDKKNEPNHEPTHGEATGNGQVHLEKAESKNHQKPREVPEEVLKKLLDTD